MADGIFGFLAAALPGALQPVAPVDVRPYPVALRLMPQKIPDKWAVLAVCRVKNRL
jgi:hypothetical protein